MAVPSNSLGQQRYSLKNEKSCGYPVSHKGTCTAARGWGGTGLERATPTSEVPFPPAHPDGFAEYRCGFSRHSVYAVRMGVIEAIGFLE